MSEQYYCLHCVCVCVCVRVHVHIDLQGHTWNVSLQTPTNSFYQPIPLTLHVRSTFTTNRHA